jgi:translation initiation factor 6 (eIF-6)
MRGVNVDNGCVNVGIVYVGEELAANSKAAETLRKGADREASG